MSDLIRVKRKRTVVTTYRDFADIDREQMINDLGITVHDYDDFMNELEDWILKWEKLDKPTEIEVDQSETVSEEEELDCWIDADCID